MDIEQLKPVADLLTEWITQEGTRGRFNEYRRGAGSAYELHKLLMNASARLYLDGRRPPDITKIAPGLLAGGSAGWRLRAQLFFEVIAGLSAAGVPLGNAEDGEAEGGDIEPRFDDDGEYEEAYA